jgi:hypothetical protein
MLVRTLRGLVAATALLAAVSSTAAAQAATGESRFAISGGVDMPMGDFADLAKMGFVVGGQFSMPLGEILKFRLNADYARNGFHDDVVAFIGDGNWTRLGVMANVIYPIGGEMGAYGLGGLGYYSLGSDVDGTDSEQDLAWNLGFGVGKGRWFVEARYQSIMNDPNLTSLPIVFGIRF